MAQYLCIKFKICHQAFKISTENYFFHEEKANQNFAVCETAGYPTKLLNVFRILVCALEVRNKQNQVTDLDPKPSGQQSLTLRH